MPRIVSDLSLILWVGKSKKRSYIWRLNEEMLNSSKVVEQIKKETKDYFELNLDKEVDIQTVWDAYKAIIRGIPIKLASEQKKNREKRIKELQVMIKIKEQDQVKKPKEKKMAVELKILR